MNEKVAQITKTVLTLPHKIRLTNMQAERPAGLPEIQAKELSLRYYIYCLGIETNDAE